MIEKETIRPKVAVFIDYTLRTPLFSTVFAAFKQYMFTGLQDNQDLEGDILLRNFWQEEIKKPEVEQFYMKSIPPEDDINTKRWLKYFYNDEHYMRFIEDYSFNLYVDASVPCNKDVELLNIAQKYLFDVVLVDEYYNSRKKTNTFFFLSKTRVTPHSVVFLKEGDKLNEEEFLGIWNPKINSQQINGENLGEFEMWLKELESKLKQSL